MSGFYWCIWNPWQDLDQIDEFGGGSHDGCSPYAIMMMICGYEKRKPSYKEGEEYRTQMIANGWFDGGATMQETVKEIQKRGYHPIEYIPWQNSTLTAEQINKALSYHVAVIFEVHEAFDLPENEPKVNNHFIVVAGENGTVNPPHAYLLNSDIARNFRPPNGGPTQGLWSHDIVKTLQQADARSYVVVPPNAPVSNPSPKDAVLDAKVAADIAALEAEVNKVIAMVDQLKADQAADVTASN